MATVLVNAGLTTFDKILAMNTRDLELVASQLQYNLLGSFYHFLSVSFYRASRCEGGLGSRNSVCPSVRLSVTHVHCDKTK